MCESAEVETAEVDLELCRFTQLNILAKMLSNCFGGSGAFSSSKCGMSSRSWMSMLESATRIISATTSNISVSPTSFHLSPIVCNHVPVMVLISMRMGASAQLVLVRRYGGCLLSSKNLRCVFPTPGKPRRMQRRITTLTNPSFKASSK